MAEHYLTIKTIHYTCAYISITLLMFRIFLSINHSSLLQTAVLKYVPHIIDSILLLCAILMLTVIGPQHPFILMKIVLLCSYIGFGYITLHVLKTTVSKVIGAALTLFIFYVIVGVATYKSPLSWWAV